MHQDLLLRSATCLVRHQSRVRKFEGGPETRAVLVVFAAAAVIVDVSSKLDDFSSVIRRRFSVIFDGFWRFSGAPGRPGRPPEVPRDFDFPSILRRSSMVEVRMGFLVGPRDPQKRIPDEKPPAPREGLRFFAGVSSTSSPPPSLSPPLSSSPPSPSSLWVRRALAGPTPRRAA